MFSNLGSSILARPVPRGSAFARRLFRAPQRDMSSVARRLFVASRARLTLAASSHVPLARTVASLAQEACWRCKETPSTSSTSDFDFFCSSCGAIQPPSGANHFSVLGVAERFALDAAELEEAMKRRQKVLHPDKFSAASETERRHSADQASAVNEAYGVLRDPLRRAKYLLDARGWGVTERDGRDTPVDPELLMEVMEAREAIMDARGDAGKLRELLKVHGERVEMCVEETQRTMDAKTFDGESAKDAVVRLTYFVRIVEEIKELL